MRGLLEEEYVRTELYAETTQLLEQFDNWKPTSKVLKDVKFRLEAVKSKLWMRHNWGHYGGLMFSIWWRTSWLTWMVCLDPDVRNWPMFPSSFGVLRCRTYRLESVAWYRWALSTGSRHLVWIGKLEVITCIPCHFFFGISKAFTYTPAREARGSTIAVKYFTRGSRRANRTAGRPCSCGLHHQLLH